MNHGVFTEFPWVVDDGYVPKHDLSGTVRTDCLQNGQGWCVWGSIERQSVLAVPLGVSGVNM